MDNPTHNLNDAIALIRDYAPNFKPRLGLVLGTGAGGLTDKIKNPITISFEELPGFTGCGVEGHHSQMILGTLAGTPVVALQGRLHYYVGESNIHMRVPIRVLKLIGCETILLTNASGAIRDDIAPGSLVLIKDHLNFQGQNPLVGPNDDEIGPRFVDMSNAYNPDLRQTLLTVAKNEKITLTEGTYLATLGPSYETPAEINAFKLLGADIVAMSLVSEVIIARHAGLNVAAISIAANKAAGLSEAPLSHDAILEDASNASGQLERLIMAFIQHQYG